MAGMVDFLRERLGRMVRADRVPGATLALWRQGVQHVAAVGNRRVRTDWACSPDTAYTIGCVIKPMTALAVLTLVERGLLDLDAPLGRYLPPFRTGRHCDVPVRYLLDHRCGLMEELSDIPLVQVDDYDGCYGRMSANYAGYDRLFPPGRLFSYSSAGYTLCGALIEAVTAARPEDFLQDIVLDPLGIANPFGRGEAEAANDLSCGHVLTRAGMITFDTPTYRCMNMAGSSDVKMTVAELIRFARVFMAPQWRCERRIASEWVLRQMVEPSTRIEVSDLPYHAWGLGWARNGERLVFHMGGTRIGFAGLFMVPDAGVAIALLTNRATYSPHMFALISELLDKTAGVTFSKPEDSAANTAPAGLEPSVFRGSFRTLDAAIEIELRDERLFGTYRYLRTRMANEAVVPFTCMSPVGTRRQSVSSGQGRLPFTTLHFLSTDDPAQISHLRGGRYIYRRVDRPARFSPAAPISQWATAESES